MENVSDSVSNSIPPLALVHASVGPVLCAMAVLNFLPVDCLHLSRVSDVVTKVMINHSDDFVVIDGFKFHNGGKLDLDWVI